MKINSFQKKLRPILRPLSKPYAFAMRQRRMLYNRETLEQYEAGCPCIAIGNISVGGTGKTPFTGWMLEWAKAQSLSAVILSRGYGAKQGNAPVIVNAATPASVAGDEPLLLARDHPDATVISFPKRAVSARMADRTLSPDIMILDDGMQHLAIKRDADIILLQEADLGSGWNRVLPEGLWREGQEALSGAAAFAVKTDAAAFKRLEPLARKRLERYGVPFFSFSLTPSELQPLYPPHSGVRVGNADAPTFKDYLLLSGVGNPGQVAATAATLTGREPAARLDYADHYAYRPRDVAHILAQADGRPVLCTTKDAVKLEPLLPYFKGHPVFVMRARVEFGPALFTDLDFPAWWDRWWREHKGGPGPA